MTTASWLGTIVSWRGTYGFIRPDFGGRDVFVRGDLLRIGDRVRFTPVPNDRRPGQLMAVDAERIGEVPLAALACRATWTAQEQPEPVMKALQKPSRSK